MMGEIKEAHTVNRVRPQLPTGHEGPPVQYRRPYVSRTSLRLFVLALVVLGAHYPFIPAQAQPGAHAPERSREALAAFHYAETLCDEWKADSFSAAVEKYKEAAAAWLAIGDRRAAARSLSRAGEIDVTLSRYREAVAALEQALRLVRPFGDRAAESEILNSIADAHIFLGEPRQAAALAARSLSLGQRARLPRAIARSFYNLGTAHYYLGDTQRALKLLRRSLDMRAELKDARGRAEALAMIGWVQLDRGEMESASLSLNDALSLWRETGDRRGEAMTILLLACHRLYTGEYQEALNLSGQALQSLSAIGNRFGEGGALNATGYTYLNLGQYDRALGYYEKAVEVFQRVENHIFEGASLANIGDAYHLLHKEREALSFYAQALKAVSTSGDRLWIGLTLQSMGDAHAALGERREALEAYDDAWRAFVDTANRRWQANALNGIGQVYYQSGDLTKAAAFFQRALPQARAADDPSVVAAILLNQAKVARDGRDLEKARGLIEESVGIVESLRTNVDGHSVRTSFSSTVHGYYETYVNILMSLHERRPSEGFDAEAFLVSERSRARTLLDTLAEARVNLREEVDPSLLREEQELRDRLNAAAEQRRKLYGSAADASLSRAIGELTQKLDDVRTRIRAANPHYTSLTRSRPIGPEEVRRELLHTDDTILLEYMLGEEQSYLWVVTGDRLMSYRLPRRADIEAAGRRVYDLLTAYHAAPGEDAAARRKRVAEADQMYWTEASQLSALVLGPAAPLLDKGGRLLVVADGILEYLPFAALPLPSSTTVAQGEEQATPLVARFETVSLPSATAASVIRKETSDREPAPLSVAVFADPVFEQEDSRFKTAPASDGALASHAASPPVAAESATRSGQETFGRLPGSREEAKAIVSLVPADQQMLATGFDASRAAAMNPALSRYRVLHLATHGVIDSDHPELSGLVLSMFERDGRPQEGFLRLHDIYNLNLPAELVVLSACDTALGQDVKGEGLVGLTRGFMYAGAASVMASLWRVDDEATVELMRRFYKAIFDEGLAPTAALRKTQLQMMGERRWRAPYYWAAFVIQGRPDVKIGPVRHESSGSTRLVVLIFMTTSAIFSLFVFASKRYRRRSARSREVLSSAGLVRPKSFPYL